MQLDVALTSQPPSVKAPPLTAPTEEKLVRGSEMRMVPGPPGGGGSGSTISGTVKLPIGEVRRILPVCAKALQKCLPASSAFSTCQEVWPLPPCGTLSFLATTSEKLESVAT